MYKKILIALALDQGHGKRAVELARLLGADDAEIVAVHVIDHVPGFSRVYAGDIDKDEVAQAARASIIERVGDIGDIQPELLPLESMDLVESFPVNPIMGSYIGTQGFEVHLRNWQPVELLIRCECR